MDKPIRNIELRSEEVQDIMGKMPPSILRWGTTVIALVVMILLVGSYFFQYPEKLSGLILIEKNEAPVTTASLFVPANASEKVKVGQKVHIQLDNYPMQEFGSLTGEVVQINPKPLTNGTYECNVRLSNGLVTSYKHNITSKLQLIGQGEIVVSKQRLLMRLFRSRR